MGVLVGIRWTRCRAVDITEQSLAIKKRFNLCVPKLPNWDKRVAFVMASLVVTRIQQIQFCLNHLSSSVYHGRPNGNDWFEKQTHRSLDISCLSWMDWFHGGLQFQIEHYLFPSCLGAKTRKISPLVKRFV